MADQTPGQKAEIALHSFVIALRAQLQKYWDERSLSYGEQVLVSEGSQQRYSNMKTNIVFVARHGYIVKDEWGIEHKHTYLSSAEDTVQILRVLECGEYISI